jgi:serine/threonine protein kinase
MALDISTALEYMHQMRVTHIDLKLKNVIISREWNTISIDVRGIGDTTDEFLLSELFEVLNRCLENWKLRV